MRKECIILDKYIFIGPSRVGKSNLILSISKVLAKLNKKVLVIDTTISQGIKSFFEFNFQIEPEDPLKDLKPVVREGFDMLFTKIEDKFAFDKLDKVNFNKYDYVFIEADRYFDRNLIGDSKVYLLQDYDKDTLEKNKDLLMKLNISLEKLQVVFVNRVESICDNMYFLSELITCLNKKFKERNEDIDIDFSEQDYVNILSGKLDGHVYLSDFSDEYKSSLFNVVNKITDIDFKKYRKIVR